MASSRSKTTRATPSAPRSPPRSPRRLVSPLVETGVLQQHLEDRADRVVHRTALPRALRAGEGVQRPLALRHARGVPLLRGVRLRRRRAAVSVARAAATRVAVQGYNCTHVSKFGSTDTD
jgi:hypothetical protein